MEAKQLRQIKKLVEDVTVLKFKVAVLSGGLFWDDAQKMPIVPGELKIK